MLMGVEKKKREAKDMDSSCSLTSQFSAIYDPGNGFPETCKDVDVVYEHVECSTSTMGESEMITDHKPKHQPLTRSRSRHYNEYDAEDDIMSVTSSFELQQKGERIAQRGTSVPFSKSMPSKWEDAQKWIASPTSNRAMTSQLQSLKGTRKTSSFSNGGRKPCTKVVVEVPDEKFAAFKEGDTKKMNSMADMYGKSVHMIEKSIHEPAICLSQHDSSLSIQTATTIIPSPSTARSVSMRDTGTEMTPIASQEPSRTGTPVKVKSPMHSPNSSSPSTPSKAHPLDEHEEPTKVNVDLHEKEVSEKEKQMKTRKEIMELGVQLGKTNIAAWASNDGEEKSTSTSMKSIVESRAEAWEEAEKAKYMARFEREEMEIQAWENHQKAKTEAEMRKIEVEVERMKAKAQDKLMNKLAYVRHKAEEKRASAEAEMSKEVAKTEQQTEYIRKTGRIPSKFSCLSWCC